MRKLVLFGTLTLLALTACQPVNDEPADKSVTRDGFCTESFATTFTDVIKIQSDNYLLLNNRRLHVTNLHNACTVFKSTHAGRSCRMNAQQTQALSTAQAQSQQLGVQPTPSIERTVSAAEIHELCEEASRQNAINNGLPVPPRTTPSGVDSDSQSLFLTNPTQLRLAVLHPQTATSLVQTSTLQDPMVMSRGRMMTASRARAEDPTGLTCRIVGAGALRTEFWNGDVFNFSRITVEGSERDAFGLSTITLQGRRGADGYNVVCRRLRNDNVTIAEFKQTMGPDFLLTVQSDRPTLAGDSLSVLSLVSQGRSAALAITNSDRANLVVYPAFTTPSAYLIDGEVVSAQSPRAIDPRPLTRCAIQLDANLARDARLWAESLSVIEVSHVQASNGALETRLTLGGNLSSAPSRQFALRCLGTNLTVGDVRRALRGTADLHVN